MSKNKIQDLINSYYEELDRELKDLDKLYARIVTAQKKKRK